MRRNWLTYEQIANEMSARIIEGECQPGERLPSKTELAQLYSVSAATIEKVHIVLRERGLVIGRPGRGVYVARRDEWRYPYV
ncbi:MAG: GntR family transcriptional regulator [Actinobacteria bacterium]|nr:MAG: GntR family transcriptional regulator [Actinomycetota bacterium]